MRRYNRSSLWSTTARRSADRIRARPPYLPTATPAQRIAAPGRPGADKRIGVAPASSRASRNAQTVCPRPDHPADTSPHASARTNPERQEMQPAGPAGAGSLLPKSMRHWWRLEERSQNSISFPRNTSAVSRRRSRLEASLISLESAQMLVREFLPIGREMRLHTCLPRQRHIAGEPIAEVQVRALKHSRKDGSPLKLPPPRLARSL